MKSKTSGLDLIGLVMVIIVASVMVLLLVTNRLFLAKSTLENSSQGPSFSEEVNPAEYQSILKHTERAVDTLKGQLSSQEKYLDY